MSSFSRETKSLLCFPTDPAPGARERGGRDKRRDCCLRSMLYGMLLFATTPPPARFRHLTEHEGAARQLADLLCHVLRIDATVSSREDPPPRGASPAAQNISRPRQRSSHDDPAAVGGPTGRLYRVTVEGEDALRALSAFCPSADRIERAKLRCPNCSRALARGAFLSAGSVSDPRGSAGYHLDLTAGSLSLAEDLRDLLATDGIFAKVTRRGKGAVVYFKGSEAIEDFLTYIGAGQAALAMMDATIYRDIRNRENRASNCDTANIAKTVYSSSEQMRAIRVLRARGDFDALEPDLRATALLREANPEWSLRELALAHTPPITKSGVNHRLHKLISLAERPARPFPGKG